MKATAVDQRGLLERIDELLEATYRVPALERAAKDRVRMPLTRQRTHVR